LISKGLAPYGSWSKISKIGPFWPVSQEPLNYGCSHGWSELSRKINHLRLNFKPMWLTPPANFRCPSGTIETIAFKKKKKGFWYQAAAK
jgi:hypothetical protein